MSVQSAQKATGLTPTDHYALTICHTHDGHIKVGGQNRITSHMVSEKTLTRLVKTGLVTPNHPYRLTGSGRQALEIWAMEHDR